MFKNILKFLKRGMNQTKEKELEVKEDRAKKASQQYNIKIWEARELIEIIDTLEIFNEHLKKSTNSDSSILMRKFSYPRWLNIMERLQLVSAKKMGIEIEWCLTPKGITSLRENEKNKLAFSIFKSGRPGGNLAGPRITGKFHGIARVLETGWKRGTIYEKDNPSGFATGQWINVEVIEGAVYLNGPFYPGDNIIGIWSYGGDTGIIGKPKKGDLVGYYEEYPAKLWEKIENIEVPNKWHSEHTRSNMDKHKFQRALELEKTHTVRAVILYKELSKENKAFHYDIFILSVICPIFAAIISYFSCQSVEKYQTLNVLLILIFLGYCPSLLVFSFKEGNKLFKKIGWQSKEYKNIRFFNRLLLILFYLITIFFGNALFLAYVLIIAVIIVTPILLPISFILNTKVPALPIYVGLPIQILAFLTALAYVFSATHPRISPLKEVFADMVVGMVFGFSEILQFFAGIVIGAIFVGVGVLGIIYFNIYEYIIVTTISGIMLGFSIASAEQDIFEGNLIRFGKVRSYLRLNERAKARYILQEINNTGKYGLPESAAYHVEALWLIEKGVENQNQKNDIKKYLNYSTEVVDYIEDYCEEWMASLRETGLLAGIKDLTVFENNQ